MLLEQLSEQQFSIPYRPNIAKKIWVIPAIILQQMIYRGGKWKFYKFTGNVKHKLYKNWDSWSEELWLTLKEFTYNLKKIAFKLWKTANTIKKENALIIYYKDNNNLTRYEIQKDNIEQFLRTLQNVSPLGNDNLSEPKRVTNCNNLYTENTTKNTTYNKINIKEKQFDEFIKLYPLKKSKAKAKIYYMRNKNIIHNELMEAVKRMIKDHEYKKAQWIWVEDYKHPSTRLYNECWTDEYEEINIDEIKKNELETELKETGWSENFIKKYWIKEKHRIKVLLSKKK